jgi:uncharacterized protein YbbK (DUF523 family)
MEQTTLKEARVNKTDGHDITEILLKVALNTINQSKKLVIFQIYFDDMNL